MARAILVESLLGNRSRNRSAYVLDSDLNLVPQGMVGELYVGGEGISRGYLNLPEISAERFIVNPFQTDEEKRRGIHSRLYKSGDLVRQLSDGNLSYIGRIDSQVKIRGFRIELQEIEQALMGHRAIKQAIILHKRREKMGQII